MDRILYTAMSGAKQSMDQQSVVSHNLANVDTAGFRAQLHAMRAVPVQGEAALATRASVAATTPGTDFSPGPMTTTGRELDVAIDGNGWIAVQAPDGSEAYTRRGDLQVDGDGLLMIAGRPVIGEGGPIVVPLGSQLSVGADGTLSAIGPGEAPGALVDVGRIKLVDPQAQLLRRGDDFHLAPVGRHDRPRAAAPRRSPSGRFCESAPSPPSARPRRHHPLLARTTQLPPGAPQPAPSQVQTPRSARHRGVPSPQRPPLLPARHWRDLR